MKKVSLSDVANSLGVSKTLVSFVINGRAAEKGISKKTEKKVFDKVKELDYQPNSFARTLRTGKSNTIGIIVADISNSFYARICKNIETQFSSLGYSVVFSSSEENPEKERAILKMMKDRGMDGVILSPTRPFSEEINQEFYNLGIPLVFIDRHYPESEINYVVVNNYQISFEATQHLISKGHKNIGFIGLKPTSTSVMTDRYNGFRDALKSANIIFNEKHYSELDLQDLSLPIFDKIEFLKKDQTSVTAVVASNNKVTLALLEFFKKNEISIPEDISLISFDFLDIFKIFCPPISSIQLFAENIGDESARLLMNKINGKENLYENVVIQAKFHERESVRSLN